MIKNDFSGGVGLLQSISNDTYFLQNPAMLTGPTLVTVHSKTSTHDRLSKWPR